MAEYGIPYMGSKDKIMHQMAHLFPKADHFYDLFGGGFSVTHYMIQRRSNHFKHFHFNEIRPGICDLIKKAIAGNYNYDRYKMPWVSREEFFQKKDSDAFIKMIWSFGNNGEGYLFGKPIEPYKRSMHQCVVFDEFDEIAEAVTGLKQWPENISTTGRRLFVRNRIEYLRKTKLPDILLKFLNKKDREKLHLRKLQQLEQLEQLQQLQQLEQLERLQQLERLERLERLEQLEFYTTDYRDVPINKNSVIYCDIPYQGTADYGTFSHKEFFNWAASQSNPVYISEYEIKDPRFKLVKEIKTRSRLATIGSQVLATERLYVNMVGLI